MLNRDWSLTIPVNSEVFRVKHLPIVNPKKQYLKAVIAPSFIDEGVNLYEPKRLSYREESQIFTFYLPVGIKQHSIGLKRLDDSDIEWKVELEYFFSSDSSNDFANYIIARFGELMPIFDTASSNIAVATKKEIIDVNCIQRTFKLVVDGLTSIQENRRGLSIFNSSYVATLTIGCLVDEDNGALQLSGVLAVIPPRKIYELPALGDGSCYGGIIYGKSDVVDNDSYIEITEFIAEL